VGETRVDLLHLLEDLRDAYPGALEETIVTEIVANSLDSGASHIAIRADPAQATFMVMDNGSGMRRRELARYHDIAASTKTRGQGIGFAGVGIKLGLLICDQVLTETRRGKTHVASDWHLASRHRAPWKWVPPAGLLSARGTAVRLRLQNPLSPLLDGGFIETALRRHYEALLDPRFAAILGPTTVMASASRWADAPSSARRGTRRRRRRSRCASGARGSRPPSDTWSARPTPCMKIGGAWP